MTTAVFAALSHLLVAWIALAFCDAAFKSAVAGEPRTEPSRLSAAA